MIALAGFTNVTHTLPSWFRVRTQGTRAENDQTPEVNHYVHIQEGKPRLNRSKSRYHSTESFCKTAESGGPRQNLSTITAKLHQHTTRVSQSEQDKRKTRFDYPVPSGAEI